ncbi:FadR/GntR family transcriptional regulator [Microbacterium amylolyticum]|uniref:DNA-binding FadR family transcriptional regulator n=1 Tax=Microbacterium amylolyticum TaxID=936337 RepID=A0ABS4ZIX0_9MICO|nr:GntR family transcriptional regulator [Microbacterium amylolyticum]MBP2437147.1 DNA-binding FadR family transcriptional regulator [Microbacterium amylolyticum]
MGYPSHADSRLRNTLFQPLGDTGRTAIVEQRLLDAIRAGYLPAGGRLPTESDLARSFGVSTLTVRDALSTLRERGLITTLRGRNGGSFVASDADPLATARAQLAATSRLALRDLMMHCGTINYACARLAVRRASDEEARGVLEHARAINPSDPEEWQLTVENVTVDLAALSHSERLTRESLRLQVEFAAYAYVLQLDEASRIRRTRELIAIAEAIVARDLDLVTRLYDEAGTALLNELLAKRQDVAPAANMETLAATG